MKTTVFLPLILVFSLCVTSFGSAQELSPPIVRVGYCGNGQGLSQWFHIREDNSTVNPQDYYDVRKSRLDNIWLGFSLPVSLNDDLGFEIQGGIAIPNSTGVVGNNLTGRRGWTDVETDNNTFGYLEGSFSYRMFGSTCIIGGFRWDQTNMRITGERSFGPNQQVGRFDAKVNAYIPFIGLQVMERWSDTDLSCRVICSPAVPGAYHGTSYIDEDPAHAAPYVAVRSYNQSYTSGRFFDGLLEYKHTLPGAGIVGLFFGYTYLALNDKSLGELRMYYTNTGPNNPEEIRMSFSKSYWTFGGAITFSFDLLQ